MAETIAQNHAQVLAAKRWMADDAGMERASLSPAEYVAYRMKVSAADAEALVAAVYALEEEEESPMTDDGDLIGRLHMQRRGASTLPKSHLKTSLCRWLRATVFSRV